MHNLDLKLKESQLKDIWIMLSQSCDHRCENCFESTEKGIDKDPDNLSEEEIIETIKEAVELGVNEVGIPGAGEPFHPQNINTLFKIIDYNHKNNVHTTIFTHLGFFNEDIIKRLDNYGKDVTLLAKFNSFKPEVQDTFDNAPGYTKRREKVLDLLYKYKFNDGKRLGFVTSIMTINYKEIPEIFKYARENNIIPDIDNLLPKGRGEKSPYAISDDKLKYIYEELAKIDKKEFGKEWEPTGAYVGEYSCNRYCHHLFITKTGDVHPCIGSRNVFLGNVKDKKLKEMWLSPEMKLIQSRAYDGKCTDCKLFIEGKCNSCLGRYAEHLDNRDLLKTKKVHTTGCFGFKE